jgi:hypothetical protein
MTDAEIAQFLDVFDLNHADASTTLDIDEVVTRASSSLLAVGNSVVGSLRLRSAKRRHFV